jgi:hypothetical protein
MLSDNYRARLFAPEFSKDLGGLAIKSFAEFNVMRNWLQPPIAFDMPIFFNVAHEGKCPEL